MKPKRYLLLRLQKYVGVMSLQKKQKTWQTIYLILKTDERLPSYEIKSSLIQNAKFSVLDALEKLNLSKSRSDTKRLMKSNGIRINDQIYNSSNLSLEIYANDSEIKISVGKKNIGILKIIK